MSKRRNYDFDDDENENPEGATHRSIGMIKKLSVNNNCRHEEIVDPSILEICQILKTIDSLKGFNSDPESFKDLANNLLLQFPDKGNYNALKYTNQLIEIPLNLNCDVNPSDLELYYYENFPFVREPMSISSDVIYFIENLNTFTHFKKIILKGCKLKIIPETMSLNQDEYGQNLFVVECLIYSSDGRTIKTVINNKVLSSANILFDKENLWNLVFRIIENDENINLENQRLLLSRFCINLYKCFEKMENIEVGVTVDSNLNVTILNILHNYYTR